MEEELDLTIEENLDRFNPMHSPIHALVIDKKTTQEYYDKLIVNKQELDSVDLNTLSRELAQKVQLAKRTNDKRIIITEKNLQIIESKLVKSINEYKNKKEICKCIEEECDKNTTCILKKQLNIE